MWYELDLNALLIINGANHPLSDFVMRAISTPLFWIWLYLFMLAMGFRKLGIRVFYFVCFALLSFGLAELLVTYGIKPWFARIRPCHDNLVSPFLHLIAPCAGKFGFVSGHAANSAAIASFVWASGIFSYNIPIQKIFFLYIILALYPLLNAYSRIYLGVHYPSDVIAGIILGMFCGLLAGWIFLKTVEKPLYGNIKSPKIPFKQNNIKR